MTAQNTSDAELRVDERDSDEAQPRPAECNAF